MGPFGCGFIPRLWMAGDPCAPGLLCPGSGPFSRPHFLRTEAGVAVGLVRLPRAGQSPVAA